MSDIEVRTLSNGATLLIEPMRGVRSAAISWALPGGHATDPSDHLGMASVWEELALRGSGELDSRAQAEAFDRVGASRSANARSRVFAFGSTMLGEHLGEALPLIASMVRSPRASDESLDASRDLAMQGLASLQDDPHERAVLAARSRHLPEPLNRSGFGTEDGIGSITRESAVAWWRERSVPGGSIIGVAGAVDPREVTERLEEILGDWSGSSAPVEVGTESPRGYAHEQDESEQMQIVLVHDAPAEADEHSVLERVVTSVLSGGMSGRLFTEVREKRGLCYSVNAAYRSDVDRGVVTAYVGTTPDRAQESLDVLSGELNRINESGVEASEFKRALAGMTSRITFSGESTSARAGALVGDQYTLGRPRPLEELTERIQRVTLDEVNAYLSGRSLGRVTIQTVGPKELTPPNGA